MATTVRTGTFYRLGMEGTRRPILVWTALDGDDKGSWLQVPEDALFIEVKGTFDSASVALNGWNSTTPPVDSDAGVALKDADTGSALAVTAAGIFVVKEGARWIKPIVSGGGATTALQVYVITGQGSKTGGGASAATLTSIKTAVEIMDDWDESDRAKVNLIAGVAGVTGGSGVTGTGVQRVVLATDVALPTGTNSIGTVVDGGSGKTLKRKVVSLTGSADIVALVASKVIKVYAMDYQSLSDTMTLLVEDGSGGTDLAGAHSMNTREGFMFSAVNPPAFLFKTSAGTALYATITGTGTIKIGVSYWDDDAS